MAGSYARLDKAHLRTGDDVFESSELYLDGDSTFVMHEAQMYREGQWNSPCNSDHIVMATALRHPLGEWAAVDRYLVD